MEHRNFSRIPIEVIVELHLDDGSCHYGETSDLSLDGAFIHFSNAGTLSTGDSCQLVLVLKSEEGWVRVEFSVTVAHVHQEGVGIHLEAAESAHYAAFLKLLLGGTNDIDRLLEELSKNPGGNFRFSDH